MHSAPQSPRDSATMVTISATRSIPSLLLLLQLFALPPHSAALSPTPRTRAQDATRRALWGTGLSLPLLLLRPPDSFAENILPGPTDIMFALPRKWPADPPFSGTGGFRARGVKTDAGEFEAVDPACARRAEAYIASALRPGADVLTLGGSSKTDAPPAEVPTTEPVVDLLYKNEKRAAATVAELNAAELKLPYPDESFDAVVSSLSVDALARPLDVFKEAARVLKPGGQVVVLFSNKLFDGKDKDHAYVMGAYLQYCGGGLVDVRGEDLSLRVKSLVVGDPLYVVTATKR